MKLEFFERIIKGDLMPHLIDSEFPVALIIAIRFNKYVIYDESVTDTRAEIRNGNYIEYILSDEENSPNRLSINIVKEKTQDNFIEISPEPPNNKCYCYYYLINFERKHLIASERLAFKHVATNEIVHSSIIEFVDYIKSLVRDTFAYSSLYNSTESDKYVSTLLIDTLIEIIQHFQNSYHYLFDSSGKTRNEIFNELSRGLSSKRINKDSIKGKETLYDFLKCEQIEDVINVLPTLLKNSKNKEVALMILALQKKDLILGYNEALYRAINNTLGFKCQTSGLNHFLKPSSVKKHEFSFIDQQRVNQIAEQLMIELEKLKNERSLV